MNRITDAILEYYDSEDNSQRMLVAFEMLFSGIDIRLPDDAHLTENYPDLSCTMNQVE